MDIVDMKALYVLLQKIKEEMDINEYYNTQWTLCDIEQYIEEAIQEYEDEEMASEIITKLEEENKETKKTLTMADYNSFQGC